MSPQQEEELARTAQALKALLGMGAGAAAPAGMPSAPGGASWLTPPAAPGGLPTPIGWSVAVEIPAAGRYGQGTVNIDVAFPAETFQQAPQIVQAMIQQGYNIYVRTPKPAGGFGGGGGYGGHGGGFNRGGFGGGGRY